MIRFAAFSRFVLAVTSLMLVASSLAVRAEENAINIGDYDIKYVDQGTGPLLILVHGSISDNRTWHDVVPVLARDFRVVAPTQRYYGTGEWNKVWAEFSNDLLADDLSRLIVALESGPAHLVGWSRGGSVAHKTALKYPELVRSVYLFEGFASLDRADAFKVTDEETMKNAQQIYVRTFGPVLQKVATDGPAESVGLFVDTVRGETGAFEALPDSRKEQYRDNARTIPLHENADKTRHSCESLKSNPVPLAAVFGTNSIEWFQILAKFYTPCLKPGAVLQAAGANHGWPTDQPEAFAAAVKAFASKN